MHSFCTILSSLSCPLRVSHTVRIVFTGLWLNFLPILGLQCFYFIFCCMSLEPWPKHFSRRCCEDVATLASYQLGSRLQLLAWRLEVDLKNKFLSSLLTMPCPVSHVELVTVSTSREGRVLTSCSSLTDNCAITLTWPSLLLFFYASNHSSVVFFFYFIFSDSRTGVGASANQTGSCRIWVQNTRPHSPAERSSHRNHSQQKHLVPQDSQLHQRCSYYQERAKGLIH